MKYLSHMAEGRGEPVLLLNGGLMTMSSWNSIAQTLAERFLVIRCDFHGQLRSPGAQPADLRGHAEDLAAILDHLSVERVHLLGTSFGAMVGLAFAAAHPERTASLAAAAVLAAPSPGFLAHLAAQRLACARVLAGGDPRELWDQTMPIFYSEAWLASRREDFQLRRERFATLPRAFFEGLTGLLGTLEAFDLRPLLPAIQCPALVVLAGQDQLMEREGNLAVAAGLGQARAEVFEQAGHALVVEEAARFAALCRSFILDAVAGGASALRPGTAACR
jgi:pimeloyl-ACP methyl ester carboxylesterase